jgi:hypothetical protein
LSRPHSNGLFDMTIQNSDHTTRVKVAHEVAEFESPPTPNSGGEKLGSPQRWGLERSHSHQKGDRKYIMIQAESVPESHFSTP